MSTGTAGTNRFEENEWQFLFHMTSEDPDLRLPYALADELFNLITQWAEARNLQIGGGFKGVSELKGDELWRLLWEGEQSPFDLAYQQLLAWAPGRIPKGLLVLREEGGLEPSGQAFLDQLQPFVLSRESRSEWPGTRLYENTAEVIEFRLTEESAALLVAVSSAGLLDWMQPELPEDLCLLRDDGDPFFVSITHEGSAALYLRNEELQELRRSAPAVAALFPIFPATGSIAIEASSADEQ